LFAPQSTNWIQIDKLNRPAGSKAGNFGVSAGFNDGVAIVGAQVTISPVNNNGYAFLDRFVHNQSPAPVSRIPDQYAKVSKSFAYLLPTNLFADADAGSTLSVSVTFPDGSNGLAFASGSISGVPSTAGVFRVVVSGVDDRGIATTIHFLIYVLADVNFPDSPYNRWLLENFSNTVFSAGAEMAIWGGGADPDGDGLNNREEYAFGTDPGVADDNGLTLSVAANGDFIISYYRRNNDPSLGFYLQGAQDCATWLDLNPFAVSETVEDVGGGVSFYSLRFRPPVGIKMQAYRVVATF